MRSFTPIPRLRQLVAQALVVAALMTTTAQAEDGAKTANVTKDKEALSESLEMAAEAKGKAVTMRRLEVTATVVGSIGVNFTMDKEDPAYPGATIFWATITDVPPGSTAQKAGFRLGDEIIRLNDQLVRGLSQKEFFDLVRHERKQGDLTWKIRRGVLGLDYLIVFNGKTNGDR